MTSPFCYFKPSDRDREIFTRRRTPHNFICTCGGVALWGGSGKKDVTIAGHALFGGPLLRETGFGTFLGQGRIVIREYGCCFLRKETACGDYLCLPGCVWIA